MENRNILIVEDSASVRTLLIDIFSNKGYKITVAENGKIGLDKYEKGSFPVVLTDLEMPVMNGGELIDRLNSKKFSPVIIVLTSKNKSDDIIKIMKKNIFDYIIKPSNPVEIILKVEKAFKFAEINKIKVILENEKVIRLENQLEWYKWQEKFKNRDINKIDKSLFHLMQTSFNQGAGFGSLVTISDLILSSAKKEGDSFIVKEKVFNIFIENINLVKKAMNVFQKIDRAKSDKLTTEKISYSDFYSFIKKIINNSKKIFAIKKQQALLSDFKPNDKLIFHINKEFLYDAISEIIINACKFSEKNSKITIIIEPHDDFLQLIFLNIPLADTEGRKGIPTEYENIIFEPFFRLSKLTYEDYGALDYGLGLTLTENIIKAHKGKINAYNINDYSDISKDPAEKVNITISLPVKN